MPDIVFSRHALDQMPDRGATREEIETAIRSGEKLPAERGRIAFRKNFSYGQIWKGHYYETKQVVTVIQDEGDRLVVITVYVFYFGGKR